MDSACHMSPYVLLSDDIIGAIISKYAIRDSFYDPTITVEEGMLGVILYNLPVQTVCIQRFTHFVDVGSEVSMTAQKVRQVENDLSLLAPNQWPLHVSFPSGPLSFPYICLFRHPTTFPQHD